MATKSWAIAMVIFITALTSSAQIFFKFGADRLPEILTNYHLFIGIFLYAFGALLLIIALKGGELTILYPIIATSYVWAALLSSHYFGEVINMYKWAGIFLIIIGITFISLRAKKDSAIDYVEVA